MLRKVCHSRGKFDLASKEVIFFHATRVPKQNVFAINTFVIVIWKQALSHKSQYLCPMVQTKLSLGCE